MTLNSDLRHDRLKLIGIIINSLLLLIVIGDMVFYGDKELLPVFILVSAIIWLSNFRINQSEKRFFKENERRLASIISHLPGFVYRCKNNDQWTILYVSEACLPLTGYTPQELQTMSGYNDIIVPEYRQQVTNAVAKALAAGESFEMEYQVNHRSGEKRWFYEYGQGVYDDDGNLLFLEGYVEDISLSCNAKQALIEARDKAEESDRLKTAFLANMSHEIRTPMNGILGFIELLKEPGLPARHKNEYLDLMNISGQRLLSTINDIIEISRIEAGKVDTCITPVNLNELVHYYTEFFKPEAEVKNIALFSGHLVDPVDALIMADRPKLDGILTNLVKNALKFTKSGSVEINSDIDDGNVVICVKDTGKGIPLNRQKAIFERFIQADMNHTRDYEGAGLGLAIVKAYVDIMGGTIWVESEEGKGSTFFVKFPYVKANTINGHETGTPQQVNLDCPAKSILIAEDDNVSFKLMKYFLSSTGLNIIRAVNGRECIDILGKNPEISLIFMDVKMPDMDGLEATVQIRRLNPEIPVIALTAYAMEGDKDSALQAGCTDYLTKPIGKQKILETIERFLLT
ncbi:MAG TPA: ATP-binding protein [Lentimicrobium sp.]|nr:ATP-binding protein [Lentimicrobium sp.]